MDWTKIDPKYIAHTVDQFGQQALHTVKPTYNVYGGKWLSAGRVNLGLMQIDKDFNASGTLRMRPGHVGKKTIQEPAPVRTKPPLPQDVSTPTPLEHMISAPPALEVQEAKEPQDKVSNYLAGIINELSFVQDLPPRARDIVEKAQKYLQNQPSVRARKPRKTKAVNVSTEQE